MAGEIQLNSVTLATESGGVITLDSGIDIKGNLNATGSAPVYACRAWVNFNGTGTVAIRGSGNVSSITDNGTGDYTVNFTTAMSDVNYCAVAQSRFSSTGTGQNTRMGSDNTYSNDIQTGSVNVETTSVGNSAKADSDFVSVAIYR